jgi:hypothetical protein
MRQYSRIFQRALNIQVKPVFEFIKQNPYNIQQLSQRIDTLIKPDPIRKSWLDCWGTVGIAFVEGTLKGIEKSRQINYSKKQFEDFASEWERYLQRYAATIAGERIVEITGTTVETVKGLIQKVLPTALEEGQSIPQIAKLLESTLKSEMANINKWRAVRIARTEVIGASNGGSFQAAMSTGLQLKKSWLTGGKNIRDTHIEAELVNKSIPLQNDFLVGGMLGQFPGDPRLGSSEVINCKCTLIYR